MKEQNWNDYAGMDHKWDSWRRPYIQLDNKFTLFDTGEIVACTKYTNSGGRTYYNWVGITLCNSAEIYETIPSMANGLTTPDGRKVAKAHLMIQADGSTAQQLLAVDAAAREVYFCGYSTNPLPNVPEEIQKRAQLYWPKHSDRPVSNPIRLVAPRKLDKAQKQRKEECELLIRAKAALIGTGRWRIDSDAMEEISRLVYDTDIPVLDIVADMEDDVAVHLVPHGVPTKKTEYVPYLKF
jgi:hypothetical protein